MNKEEAKELIVSLLSRTPKEAATIAKEISELNMSRARLYDLLNQLVREGRILMVPAESHPKQSGRVGRYPSRAYILPPAPSEEEIMRDIPLLAEEKEVAVVEVGETVIIKSKVNIKLHTWRIMFRAGRAETIVTAHNKLEALREGQKAFKLTTTRPLRAIRIPDK